MFYECVALFDFKAYYFTDNPVCSNYQKYWRLNTLIYTLGTKIPLTTRKRYNFKNIMKDFERRSEIRNCFNFYTVSANPNKVMKSKLSFINLYILERKNTF